MTDKIYPSMVIRSQAEAIELLENENNKLQSNWNSLREWLDRQREGYQHARIDIPIVLDEMNELEGKDNNE